MWGNEKSGEVWDNNLLQITQSLSLGTFSDKADRHRNPRGDEKYKRSGKRLTHESTHENHSPRKTRQIGRVKPKIRNFTVSRSNSTGHTERGRSEFTGHTDTGSGGTDRILPDRQTRIPAERSTFTAHTDKRTARDRILPGIQRRNGTTGRQFFMNFSSGENQTEGSFEAGNAQNRQGTMRKQARRQKMRYADINKFT